MAGCVSSSRSMRSIPLRPLPLVECKLELARHGIRLLRPSVHNQCMVYMGTGTVYSTPRVHPTAMERTVQDPLLPYGGKSMFKGAPGTHPPPFNLVVEPRPGLCTHPP